MATYMCKTRHFKMFFGLCLRQTKTAMFDQTSPSNCEITNPFHDMQFSYEFQQDIRMWLRFLRNFNGVGLILESEWLSSDNIELFRGSSGKSRVRVWSILLESLDLLNMAPKLEKFNL